MRLGVLEDAGDVAQRRLRQVGVLVAGEDRVAALPDRLVDVHARAVVAEDRLGHEAGRLAVGLGDHVGDVLIDLHVVGHGDHGAELDAELVLRGGHLVVVLLDGDAHLGHHRDHLRADVLAAIDRRHGEVAALGARTVAEVAHLVFGAGVGGQLGGVDAEAGVVRIGGEAHVVEDEELGFRADEQRVAHARRLHVGLGLLGDAARVALVELAGRRLEHVAEDGDGRLSEEGIEVRRGGIRHQQHVGGFDALPAGDRRAVEGIAVLEDVLVERARMRGHMLHLALGVGETEIDELDVLVLHHLQDIAGALHENSPLTVCSLGRPFFYGKRG